VVDAWQIEHAVETEATLSLVWSYMTEVSNWDDPPARFELDGPFAAGSQGTTVMPGQESTQWRIREVHPHRSYVIDTDLEGARLWFEWRFEPISENKTRLTQRIALSGDGAAKHVEAIQAGFGSHLAAGMERIAAAIERARSRAE
jgi:hypothetical protein